MKKIDELKNWKCCTKFCFRKFIGREEEVLDDLIYNYRLDRIEKKNIIMAKLSALFDNNVKTFIYKSLGEKVYQQCF